MNVEVSIQEQWPINSYYLIAQSEQEIYVWTEHACKRPSTCERVRYVWTGPPTDISHSRCERDDSPWQCLKACNTMSLYIPRHLARPIHTYTMRCLLGHTIYHVKPARPYHIPGHGRKAIPYIMPCLPGHTIHHFLPTRPLHISCPPGNSIYCAEPLALPARP